MLDAPQVLQDQDQWIATVLSTSLAVAFSASYWE